MATLRGHAVAIQSLGGLADHTYVTCDGGHSWPCWGRRAGGSIISTGTGSSAEANCISWPGSWAGIVYGVTGVCHQTANRILWPAGVTVGQAKGYWASWLVYHTYGTDTTAWLLRLAACSLSKGEIPQCATGGAVRGIMPLPDREDRTLTRKVKALHRKAVARGATGRELRLGGQDSKTLGAEVKLVMQHRLGSKYKAAKIQKVHDIKKKLVDRKVKIASDLYQGELTGESFAAEMNEAINDSLRKCARALGRRDYTAFMELEPGEEIILVDPKIAARAHK